MREVSWAAGAALVVMLVGCGANDASPPAPSVPTTEPEVLAEGLEAPWSVVPLPDGGALISERGDGVVLELTADGTSTSAAIRQALLDSVRVRKREQMRLEASLLVDDVEDRAESAAILAHMEELRAR